MSTSGPLQRWVSRLLGDSREPDRPLATSDLAAGARVGRYVIVERLGRGGMGVVYHARDTTLDRAVALKFLPPHLNEDRDAAQRLLVEARAAARIDHPNICTIHEIGWLDDGRSFIAMAYYEGRTLGATLREDGPMGPRRAAGVGLALARGLERAHAAGIIHRDIKPANVFLTADGPVKILDFGIAKLPGVDLTREGAAIGTVAYMSPEQIQGQEVDARTDLWALGVVLYEMCAGERPFVGDDQVVLLHQILELDPPPLSELLAGVPAEFSDLVERCLRKNRQERPVTAAGLIKVLESVVAEEPRAGGAGRGTPHSAAAPGLAAGGERRPTTVLVAELSGRGALEEALSPERVDAFVDACHTAMEAQIVRHGGIVNRRGRERTHGLFGIPVAREDDALRAVRSARALIQCVDEIAREAGVHDRVGLRCGLDSGRVVAREEAGGEARFRVVGGPAERVLRIAPLARPGDVLISEPCRRLVTPFFETEPGPAVPGDADDAGSRTFRVLAETGIRTRLEAATADDLTDLTGRDLELRTLFGALDAAARGEGALVTITGEIGVGKSRLLYEFEQRIDRERFDVARGRCLPSGSDVPYLPFVDVLRDSLGLDELDGREDARVVGERVRGIAPELEGYIPFYLQLLSMEGNEGRTLQESLAGEQLRLALVESLSALPTLRAQRRPGILLLEDWQWADGPSRQVLHQLLEMASAYPLLVVVTTRPEPEIDWGSPGRHTPIVLGPVGPEDSARIVRSVLGAEEVPDALLEVLHERTGGNPFFLEEMCHALRESGTVSVDGARVSVGAAIDRLELPDTVQGVVRTRLDRLDGDARRLIRYAAVIGREFGRDVLEHAMPGADDPSAGLERLRELGLIQRIRVVPKLVYRFKHALTQEVAYDSLLDRQRSEIHGQVGRALETLHTDLLDEQRDALAEHFARAGEWGKAVEYGMAAADRLWSLSEVAEASETQARAMEWASHLPPEEAFEKRTELLLRQERLFEDLGARDRQREVIDELLRTLDPERHPTHLATACIRSADLCVLTGDHEGAERALEAALELGRGAELKAIEGHALRSFGFLRGYQERHREAIDFVERALELERELGNERAVVSNLCNLGVLYRTLGEYDRALATLEEALAIQRRTPDGTSGVETHHRASEGYILHSIANVYSARGDNGRALAYLEDARRSEEATARAVSIVNVHYHMTAIARIHIDEGRIDEGLALYRESAEVVRRARHLERLGNSARLLGDVLLNLERYEEALPSLEEAADIYTRIKNGAAAAMWRGVAIAREALDRDDAHEAWATAAEIADEIGDTALSVEAHEGRGRTTRATDPVGSLRAYRMALERAADLGDPKRRGGLCYKVGVLHWESRAYEEALASFEAACEEFEEAGDRPDLGLALNSAGRTLRDLGRLGDARARLEEAVALNRESGERLLEAHALATLGDVLLDIGDLAAAGERFTDALDIRRSLDDLAGQGWMLCRLARVQAARGARDGVAYYASEAADIASRCGDAELQRECEALQRDTDPKHPEV